MGSGDSQQFPLSAKEESGDCRNNIPVLGRRKRTCIPRSLKSKRISMKRKARFGHRCRRKMRMLEKLVPKSCSDESMGMERVFRETADYIMALKMRVKLMQIMVDAFSPASRHH